MVVFGLLLESEDNSQAKPIGAGPRLSKRALYVAAPQRKTLAVRRSGRFFSTDCSSNNPAIPVLRLVPYLPFVG